MKIPSHYKLKSESPHAYEIHDERDGSSFQVAKSQLDLDAHAKLSKIQRFDDGGSVQVATDPNSVQVNPNLMNGGSSPDDLDYNKLIPQEQANNAPYGTVSQPQTVTQSPAQDVAPRSPAVSQPVSDPIADQATAGNSALQTEKNALISGAGAEGAQQQQTAQAYKDYAAKLDQMLTPQQIMENHKAADDALLKSYMSKSIDPDRYWKNQSTGSKIASAIGMIFSGVGSARTGQPNYALEGINNAIARDIEAQKGDQSKAMNLWKMNREATQNDMQATLATQNQLLNSVKAKALQYEANYAGPIARAKIAPTLAAIDQQMAVNNRNRALLGASSAPGGQKQIDPAQLVPMLVDNPEQQKQVYEEIGRAQNVSKNSDKILAAFDQASNDNTVLRTGAGFLRTPGSVMALHQLMLPNFKQIDGTVRQAAMDESFQNLTPAPGDSDDKIATKRQALIDWMHSETAAPVAKGHGIDLSRFTSTGVRNQSLPQIATMGGVKYMKVNGGWQKVQ